MSALQCDLYALTMIQAELDAGMTAPATFEFFVRRLPLTRGFLMAAGLDVVLEELESLRTSPDEMRWLADSGRFSASLLGYMENLRFTGDVHAMAEGTAFFADEPILRVTAPLPEAQLIEARVVHLLQYQTLVASKAARMVLAAKGKTLIDFGMRWASDADAAVLCARAAYIAGFDGTATVPANVRYGIPLSGTMAHSFVEACDDEEEAFARFARALPERPILLLDTYDVDRAAATVVALAPQLAAEGIGIAAIRLDSGDLIDQARRVRRILDAGGLAAVRIIATGGIDEHKMLAHANVPIDGYGVGAALAVSPDTPSLECAYKLQDYAGQPRRKRSEGKATWPGAKQVYRFLTPEGRISHDVLTTEDDQASGIPLLRPVMTGGRRIAPPPGFEQMRSHAARELGGLPPVLHRLGNRPAYRVEISPEIRRLAAEVDRKTGG